MTPMFHGILISNIAEGPLFTSRTSGVYRVATELRSNGWDIEVLDFFYQWTEEELEQFLTAKINKHTKFIGFSHLFPNWTEKAELVCKWIKINFPHITIVSGSTDFPHKVISDYIDYHIQGYSEYAILKLFAYLFSNGPKPELVKHNNQTILLANEHYLASPFRNPVILYQDRDFLLPNEWLGIEFSRGCKFKCAYCSFPILGVKGDWTRDTQSVELQLKDAYDKYGITQYYIADETFNDRTEKITKFANVVESLNFKPMFAGFIRPDLISGRSRDKEELLRMNMLLHNYGVESFNHESAKSIGKPMHPDKIKQGLLEVKDYFQKHGSNVYRGSINLIYGLPYETEETIWQGYDWLVKNWQGQCYRSFILQIPKRNISEIEQKYNISKMTVNFESYGYKEIDEKEANIRLKAIHRYGEVLPPRTVYWKNEITDVFKLVYFYEKVLKEKKKHDFRACIFELGFLSETHTLEDRFKLKHFVDCLDTRTEIAKHTVLAARKYVEKKLGTI